jgi:hypothetical protein
MCGYQGLASAVQKNDYTGQQNLTSFFVPQGKISNPD